MLNVNWRKQREFAGCRFELKNSNGRTVGEENDQAPMSNAQALLDQPCWSLVIGIWAFLIAARAGPAATRLHRRHNGVLSHTLVQTVLIVARVDDARRLECGTNDRW